MNGDTLTDSEYHHIIMVWKSIVQNVKLFWILYRSLIMGILIYVDGVILNDVRSIEQHWTERKIHFKLLTATIGKIVKKYTLAIWLSVILNLLTFARTVIKKLKLMVITQITQNRWMLFGYVDNAMLPFTGKIG